MPCRRAILIATVLLLTSLVAAAQASAGPEIRLLFTGDILLSRNVRVEVEAEKSSPWRNLVALFHSAGWVGGNLEGAVGVPEDCITGRKQPCFAVPVALLDYLKTAGFKALSVENNHAGDLGAAGRRQTAAALRSRGIVPLDTSGSPHFFRIGNVTLAVIALNTVPDAAGEANSIPSVELAQKLRLAHRLSNLVMVSVHWGSELLDWPSAGQRRQAEWLVEHGADLVVGHHPHVVQPPECIHGNPVFFSLGNHLFDQKYPETKQGLMADCRITGGKLRCGGLETHAPAGGFVPEPAGRDAQTDSTLAACPVQLHEDFSVAGYAFVPAPEAAERSENGTVLSVWHNGRQRWISPRQQLLDLDAAPLAGPGTPELIFTLERHYSPIDKEEGVRPYVYALDRGRLVAKWRGSALAWPLLDAVVLRESNLLCALHRGDSFLAPQPQTRATRVALYRWNGFGFKGVEDKQAMHDCEQMFRSERSQ